MSKADAREWQAEQKEIAETKKDLEQQLIALYYEAYKRPEGQYADPMTLRRAGHADVARLVDEACVLLHKAHYLLESKLNK